MPSTTLSSRTTHRLRRSALALCTLLLALPLTGCVVLGFRSGGGFFIWPGGFGLVVLILVILLLLRRR